MLLDVSLHETVVRNIMCVNVYNQLILNLKLMFPCTPVKI